MPYARVCTHIDVAGSDVVMWQVVGRSPQEHTKAKVVVIVYVRRGARVGHRDRSWVI